MEIENTVYVISPDHEPSRSLAALLSAYNIRVIHLADTAGFLGHYQPQPQQHSCLVIDIGRPDTSDLSLLQQIREEHQELPVIAVGDCEHAYMDEQAKEAGATDYIEKSLLAAYLFHRLADLIPGANQLPRIEPSVMTLADGKKVTFRMTHPEDAELQQSFITALSDRSRYMRFFSALKQLPEQVLKDFTTPRYPASFAVVAIISDGNNERQIGVARWEPTGSEGIAEFAVVVADDCQGLGIASRLMRVLITAATLGGLSRLDGLILKQNMPMLSMVKKMGFNAGSHQDAGPSVAFYSKELRHSQAC